MSFKIMSLFVGMFLLLGVFAMSFASAGNVVLKTVPAQNIWKADGVTEYRMDVYADNTGLGGSPYATQSIDWQILAPQGLSPYLTMTRAASAPASVDFFNGYTTSFARIVADWGPQGKAVGLPGPANKSGRVASYWFTVSSNTPREQMGQKSFGFEMEYYTDVRGFWNNHTNVGQPFVVQNMPFTITSNIKLATAIKVACPPSQPNC